MLGPKVIRNFIDSAIISFSDVPLKISTALGLLFSFGAFAYLALVVGRWWQGGDVPEWSPVLAVLLFLGGVQLISVGILGTYIASIFLESKGRPNFIIRDMQGFAFADPAGGDERPWHEARAEAARLVGIRSS